MRANRELLEQSALGKTQVRLCVQVLGRYVKGKTREQALKIYDKLADILKHLKLPSWATDASQISGWFMAVLKNLFKAKPEKKRQRGYNEYLQEQIEKERMAVLRRRGHREATVGEAWQRWEEEQRHERAWKQQLWDEAKLRLNDNRLGKLQVG